MKASHLRKIILINGVFFIFLMLPVLAEGATRLYKTVKPGGQGGDYTTLEDCLHANEKNLVTADQYLDIEIDGDWSVNMDTKAVVVHIYTTDKIGHYINIYTTPAARHKGVYSTNYYVLNSSMSSFNFVDNKGDIRIDGLQFLADSTGDKRHPLSISGYHFGANISISNCIIKSTGNDKTYGVYLNDGNGKDFNVFFWNNILYGFNNVTDNAAVYQTRGTVYSYNNTFYGNTTGYTLIAGTATMKNNIFNDNTFDISPTSISPSSSSVSNIFNDTPGATHCFGILADTGITDGSAANELIQSGQNFLTTVKAGMVVKNTTDNTYSYVTAVNSDTQLTLNNDIMASGEAFIIYTNMYGNVTFSDETAGNENLHLQSSDTAAKDNGINLYSDTKIAVTTDIDGDARPNSSTLFDIGADERIATVDISAPAAISNLTALQGTNEREINLTWTAPGNDGATDNITGGEYKIKWSSVNIITASEFEVPSFAMYQLILPTNTVSGQECNFVVTGLIPGTSYWFAIKTRDNSNNWSIWSSTNDVPSLDYPNFGYTWAQDLIPAKPQGLTAVYGSSFVNLSWSANTETDLAGYNVYRSSYETNTEVYLTTILYPGTTHQDTGLENNNTYYYKVTAIDNTGHESVYSDETSTFPWIAPPVAPSGFAGTVISSAGIQWSWTDNSDNEDGFKVYTDTGGLIATLGSGSGGTISWAEWGLTPNTSYYRYAQAYNVGGAVVSNSDTKYTYANAPVGLCSVTQRSRWLSLEWNINANPGNTIYEVSQCIIDTNFSAGVSTPVPINANFKSNTTGFYTLAEGATYYYRVRAMNGNNVYSEFTTVLTTWTVRESPAAATDFYASTGSVEGAINITWTSPGDDGTDVSITGGQFRIIYSSMETLTPLTQLNISTSCTENTPQAYTVNGLVPGNTYYFRLWTVDSLQNISEISPGATTWAQDLIPAKPQGLTAVYGTSLVNLSWATNTETDLAGYKIYCSSYATGTETYQRTILSPGTTHQDTGLENNNTYYYKVTAIDNTGHESVYSDETSTFPWIAPPVAPGGFAGTVISSAGIQWSWTDNSDNEDGFKVYSDTGGIIATLNAGVASWTEWGLTPNTSYYRYAQAYNVGGAAVSNSDTKYTYANVPVTLTNPALGISSITLNWNINNNPGNTIYEVSQSIVDSSFATGVSTPIPVGANFKSNTTSFYTLAEGATHYYRVRAMNGNNVYSEFTAVLTVCTNRTPIIIPTAPTGFTGVANSATSIQWSWTDNATNETGYALKDGNGVHISSLAANAVTHSEQNLNPNTAYTRYLVAYNSASESTSISTVVYTLVNAPTGLKITNYTDTSISLAWSPGAGGNTRYGISRSTTGTASADFSSLKAWGDNISTTYYTDTPLEAGVTYYYKVFGYNGEQTATDFTDTVYQMPIKINEPVLPVSRTSEVIVGNGSGNLTITLSTGVFTGVDKYYLKVSTLPISNPVHVSTITLNQANTVLALNAALKLVPNSIVEIVAYDYNHNVEITTGAADIMLTIPYADSDNDGFVDGITDVKETDLKIYTLNINSQLWELQPGVLTDDTANNTVTIKIPHFSCYALIGSTSSAAGVIRRFNTTEPIVYPNPFMPVSGNQYSAAGITFDNLPATEEVTIKIYTISGDFVNKFTKAVTEGQKKVWDGKNNSGEQVSSGIYVYYIKSDSINKKGRLAIIK